MKNTKKTVAIIAALCLALTLGACKNTSDNKTPDKDTQSSIEDVQNGTQGSQNNNIDENTGNTEEKLPENPDAPAVSVKFESIKDSISLKSTGESIYSSDIAKLRILSGENGTSEVTKKISSVMSSATERNEKQASQLKSDCLNYLEQGADTQGWVFETSCEVVRNDAYAVSIIENIYMNAGGAHPSSVAFAYNFDSRTGSQLTFDSLIGGTSDEKPDEFTAMDKLIRSKLAEKYGEQTLQSAKEYLGTVDLDESIAFINAAEDCWYFDDQGITIYYSTYKIAPYAAGDFEIQITPEELAQISTASNRYFK